MSARSPVLAIDPGYEQSAWVLYDGRWVSAHGIQPNEDVRNLFRGLGLWQKSGGVSLRAIVFEAMESFGMGVGHEVFETVFWTGRLFEMAQHHAPICVRLSRKAVKLHLCQSLRAQDSNIRTALADRFGGKASAIGTKKIPGPLYGLKSHEWSALALAITWWDQCVQQEM